MNVSIFPLGYAWRALIRRPTLALLTGLVLALGIGGSTMLFAVVWRSQIEPLPFHEPERLVQIAMSHRERPQEWEDIYATDFRELVGREDLFEAVAGFGIETVALGGGERPERVTGARITPGLLPLLGVAPAVGRGFDSDDAIPGAPAVVLLSDALWRNRHAADPGIVGRTIRVNRSDATVVGVMPPGFAFPYDERVWLPLALPVEASAEAERRLIAVARLRPEVGLTQAAAAVETAFEVQRARAPELYRGYAAMLQPLSWLFVDWQSRLSQRALFALVFVLLLIAAANAAGLLLAAGIERGREFAVRAALGASPGRRAWTVLSEVAWIVAFATAAGVGLAQLGLIWLDQAIRSAEDPLPYYLRFDLPAPALGFALLTGALVWLVAGFAPARHAAFLPTADVLRAGMRAGGDRRESRIGAALSGVQLALSVVMVTAALLMSQSFGRMLSSDVGARTDHVLTARIAVADSVYDDEAVRRGLVNRLGDELRAAPGVVAATLGTGVPGFTGSEDEILVEDVPADTTAGRVRSAAVDFAYLDTYGIRLLAGRDFNASDAADSEPVAIVDSRFVERHFGGRDPLGRRIAVGTQSGTPRWLRIIGVIEPLHLAQVDDPRRPAVLAPLAQHPERYLSIAVRTRGAPDDFALRLSEIVRVLDPELPLYWLRSLDDAIAYGRSLVTITTQMVAALGLLGLLLAAIGIYGLLSTRVARRLHEFGVRRALGAPSRRIAWSAFRSVAWPLVLGLSGGLALSIPFGRLLSDIEPELLGADAWTALGVPALMLLVGLAAVLRPLYVALRVDPMVALRYE
jgi:predicted permease